MLTLASCFGNATSSTVPQGGSKSDVADLLLNTDDLDQLRPGIWTEAEKPPELEGPGGTTCGVECAVRLWTAPGGSLAVTLNRHEKAEQAAEALAQAVQFATTELGYVEIEPPDHTGLPDKLWLGMAEGDGLPRFVLHTQQGQYLG
jgi:hypothetical protein